jgi:hypothetical protein
MKSSHPRDFCIGEKDYGAFSPGFQDKSSQVLGADSRDTFDMSMSMDSKYGGNSRHYSNGDDYGLESSVNSEYKYNNYSYDEDFHDGGNEYDEDFEPDDNTPNYHSGFK